MSDEPGRVEPWFYELEPSIALGEDDQEKVDTLTAAGRAIVLRMVEQVALDQNVAVDGMTAQFADMAIDRVRDAIVAARDAGPGMRANTDMEELALRYMEAMRLYMRIYRAAQNRTQ